MIVSQNTAKPEEFKKIFNKKFKNFCNKLPILVSYVLQPHGVTVYEHIDDKDMENKTKLFYFEYDYEIPVEKNIFKIKNILKKHLPIMQEKRKTEVKASTEELNKMVSEGKLTFDDLSKNGYYTTEKINWRIEKVIIERDEIFVRNMNTNMLYRYHLKYPVVVFLKKIRSGDLNSIDAWKFFSSKSVEKPMDTRDEGEDSNNAQETGKVNYD